MKNFTTSWIDDRMPYQVLDTRLSAEKYNVMRLGILRLGSPLTFDLNDVKGLRCVMDDHAWVFVDRFVNDMPLLAWTQFERRSDLNKEISCELRLYHFKADLLVDKALRLALEAVDEQMQQRHPLVANATVARI